MKRSLLLIAVSVLALAVPTTASACQEICESAFLPCVYEEMTYSYCIWDGRTCWMHYCPPGYSTNPELLSTKWKIASVEIERRGPVDKRQNEVQVASNVDTESAKPELPCLK